jgi:quercetin dioxygenase-like cupin family protein
MSTALRTCAVVAFIGGAVVSPSLSAQQKGVKRTDLQRHDLSAPGREAVQVRVELDPGVAFPRHSHPGEEIIFVLEGQLEYRIDGQPPATLHAGDVYFIPAGAVHTARNVGSGRGAELATYIVKKGKPLVVIAK